MSREEISSMDSDPGFPRYEAGANYACTTTQRSV